MIILADFQTYRISSDQPLHPDAVHQIFDLSHILKEMEPEFGSRFHKEKFFEASSLWDQIRDFKFFSWAELNAEDGTALGWLCLLDRTERKNSKIELLSIQTLAEMLMEELFLRKELIKSERIQNEIIQLAAHDLKNPLAGIIGISDHILYQKENTEELGQIADLIKDSSKRMLHILEDILKSGFLESGRIKLKVSPSNFNEIVLQAIRGNQASAQQKSQVLKIEQGEEAFALVDRHRMLEILDNLISNAVKYAPKGAEIEASTRLEKDQVLFSIYNPGVGLSEEDMGRIFQKFCKLSAKPTGGETSTGLGLSIVKMLAELHGGSISAESDGLTHGVRFILQIPALAQVA
jgi:signal transduction histidine kinase